MRIGIDQCIMLSVGMFLGNECEESNMVSLEQLFDGLSVALKILIEAAPTLVALLAIYINNKSAKRRDKINREASSKLKILWDICDVMEELYFTISRFGAEVFSQKSSGNSEQDMEDNERIWELGEEVISVQRKVKISSEIYETVGEIKLNWAKVYDSCDAIMDVSQKILEDIFGNEETNQELKKDLENSMRKFEVEYKNYTQAVREEIKRIIES